MRTAALHNLGCKVNAYETEAMEQLLVNAGYKIVPFTEVADVYVVNTCSVTNMADKKSRQMLHRAKKLNPESVVVAAGCYVQTKIDEAKMDDAIDIIIGNNKKQDLVRLLDEYFNDSESNVAVLDINSPQSYEELKVFSPAEHTRAFLKVQDGCNQFCTYCIIPYARGRVRSRALEDVVEETKALAANGFKEIVLTGIHLDSYGMDIDKTLLDLIKAVNEIDGIERIRLGSLEPNIITEEFVQAISSMKKFCPHFHLSLQSGSNTVLKRMNRHYTAEKYLEKCELLRQYFEHPAITTDIIVGFPGETEEEFAETFEFAKAVGFYEIHVFKYSRRDGTIAAKMKDQIPEKIKGIRSNELMALAADMKQEFINYYQGKELNVLLEEPLRLRGKNYFTGYTPEYVKIGVLNDEDMSNKIVMAKPENYIFVEC